MNKMGKPLQWRLLSTAVLLTATLAGIGQEQFAMENAVVTDCSGFLTDSGEGGPYSSDEFLTFTVLVDEEAAVPIQVDFLSQICIETGFDSLVLYDGASSTSPVLGVYTGFDFTPPTVVATSGAVTFVFASDASANYCGFSLAWEALAPPPSPPTMAVALPVACPAASVHIDIDPPVGCLDIDLESWTVLSGGGLQGVALGAPELVCEGDSATGFNLSIDAPLPANCNWEAILTMGRRDACDSLHVFEVPLALDITTCPIVVVPVDPPAALCAGTCANITFEALGCQPHVFNWSEVDGVEVQTPGEANLTEVTICPPTGSDTVLLELGVEQPGTGLSQSFSWAIPVESPAWQIEPALPPYCSAAPGPALAAVPPGGTFSADPPDIIDPISGATTPDGLNGPVAFTYTTTHGCQVDTTLVFQWLSAGPDLTTCLGGEDLQLIALGVGGLWSGGNATASGLYTPDATGMDTLVVSSAQCSDTMLIEVIVQDPPLALPSICATDAPFLLPDLPAIGTWSGPGVSGTAGWVDPNDVPTGPVTWTYSLAGCAQLATSTLLPIAVEPASMVTCPEQAGMPASSFATPVGGTWTGPGVTSNGTFYPGVAPEDWGIELIYTAPNGCQDTVSVNNVTTQITPATISTCQGVAAVEVHDAGWGFQPWCGDWSGPGFSFEGGCAWFWDPASVPVGSHTLVFSANTCVDSVTVTVWPDQVDFQLPDAGWPVCVLAEPMGLAPANLLFGGTWSGPGVTAASGLFSPGSAGPGNHWVFWEAPGGCLDSTQTQVEAWEQAELGLLPDPWCHADAAWSPAGLSPSTATWAIDGTEVEAFSMDTLATGGHTLTVGWSGLACSSADTIEVQFEAPIDVSLAVSDTLICPMTSTSASASASGGLTGAEYNWSWSHGGFPTNTTTFAPNASSVLVVTVNDGCSDAAQDSVWVAVAPDPAITWTPEPIRCFGEPSSGVFGAEPPAFQLAWMADTMPPPAADSAAWTLSATAGATLSVTLVDDNSGCTHDTLVELPSYSPVSAGFQPNPGLGPDSACVPWELAPIALLDFSAFVAQGLWWAEDGNGDVIWSEAYQSGQTPAFTPPLPGPYAFYLSVENEGGCSDAASADICVSPPTAWFLPDMFSPNGDGLNDRLRVLCEPLETFQMEVFNRFGERVAVIGNPEEGWDGLQRGNEAPTGAYGIRLDMLFTTGVHIVASASVLLVR